MKHKSEAKALNDAESTPLKIPSVWTFDNNAFYKKGEFSRHINTQLPWYSDVLDLVAFLANAYLPVEGTLVDLGCSTGNVTRAMRNYLVGKNALAVSYDKSKAMIAAFEGYGEAYPLNIVESDSCIRPFDVAVSMLTTGFLTVADRIKLAQKLKQSANPGAVLIIVEKTLSANSRTQEVLRRWTLQSKLKAGETPDSISAKELSLSGVLSPLSNKHFALFGSRYDEFFRSGEFAGRIVYLDKDEPVPTPTV